MAKPKRSGLGKGLEVLFSDNSSEEKEITTLPIEQIEPNRLQPRREFSPAELAELEGSIKEHGVLQPLIVRAVSEGRYQIVAGERRFRASKQAGLLELPVIIKELSDKQTMEIALVENLMREDLSPIEEAKGIKTLMEKHEMTQEDVAKRIGRSRSAVANSLRLLSLSDEILAMVNGKKLTAGHARALVGVEESVAITVAMQIIKNGLNVRQTEQLIKDLTKAPKQTIIKQGADTSFYKEIELSLGEFLGRKVNVVANSTGKGKLTLSFHSKEELKEFAKALSMLEGDEE